MKADTLRPELKEKICAWLVSFHRLDPRYKILTFFNQVASYGADNMCSEDADNDVFDVAPQRPLTPMEIKIRDAFNNTSILTVWRPCSNDAMRHMMQGTGVGKGLDIKGKSAKKGKLSAFVPFMQIHQNDDKQFVSPIGPYAKLRVYFKSEAARDYVFERLNEIAQEQNREMEEEKRAMAAAAAAAGTNPMANSMNTTRLDRRTTKRNRFASVAMTARNDIMNATNDVVHAVHLDKVLDQIRGEEKGKTKGTEKSKETTESPSSRGGTRGQLEKVLDQIRSTVGLKMDEKEKKENESKDPRQVKAAELQRVESVPSVPATELRRAATAPDARVAFADVVVVASEAREGDTEKAFWSANANTKKEASSVPSSQKKGADGKTEQGLATVLGDIEADFMERVEKRSNTFQEAAVQLPDKDQNDDSSSVIVSQDSPLVSKQSAEFDDELLPNPQSLLSNTKVASDNISVTSTESANRTKRKGKRRSLAPRASALIGKFKAVARSAANEKKTLSRMTSALRLYSTSLSTSCTILDDYAPKHYGIECAQRLFWKAFVLDQDITMPLELKTGRPSTPGFQDANLYSLANGLKQKTDPLPVLIQMADGDEEAAMAPQQLVMGYEEAGSIRPVVSDFDGFLLGWRREALWFGCDLPREQEDLMLWCVDKIESILDAPPSSTPWTTRWLEILKKEKKKGFHPYIPPYGFGDPKSYAIMENAALCLIDTGAVRHGSECFNYYFPQEMDDFYLVISDTLTPVPWKYVDERELRAILSARIAEGFMFPLNPKWILCDPGWKKLYDEILASNALYADLSKDVWFPPLSGVRNRIDAIHQRHPGGFRKRAASFDGQSSAKPEHASLKTPELLSGQAAAELAELELEHYDGYESQSDDGNESGDGGVFMGRRRGRKRGKERSNSVDGKTTLNGLHGGLSNRALTVDTPQDGTPINSRTKLRRWFSRFQRNRRSESGYMTASNSGGPSSRSGSWLSTMFGGGSDRSFGNIFRLRKRQGVVSTANDN